MNMEDSIRVIQYGLGPIGQAIVRDLLGKTGIQIVGAVDTDEQKVGKDLGDVAALDTQLGVSVSSNFREVPSNEETQLVVLSTVSSLSTFRVVTGRS